MEGCLVVQPLLLSFWFDCTRSSCCELSILLLLLFFFFFRFIFSDVDLNSIMHSSVWCVVLTFLLLLLITQDGNGKLSIFCSQNLNSFSSLASPYKFSGRTCSYSNPHPGTPFFLVPRVFRPRHRAHNGTREDAWQPGLQS